MVALDKAGADAGCDYSLTAELVNATIFARVKPPVTYFGDCRRIDVKDCANLRCLTLDSYAYLVVRK
jgi:hypothetical protein